MRGGKTIIFFALFWSAITLLFDGVMGHTIARQLLAKNYRATSGIIVSSQVTHHDGDDGEVHGVRITYSYTVAGGKFQGDRFRFDSSSSSDSKWAHEAVQEHPVGSVTTVYYDPRDPQNAILSPGLEGSDLFFLLFMTPFNVVMLFLWWFVWSYFRNKLAKPVAGGIKVLTDLRWKRARMTEFSPLAAGLAAAGLVAFVSTFVVCIVFGGFHPSFRVAAIAWGFVLAGGIATALWYQKTIVAGTYDLEIDELNRTIRLPRTCGRTAVRTVPFSDIHGAFVDVLEKKGSDGNSYTYVPTLRLSNPGGPIEKLAEWYDESKARGFVTWLNEQL